MKSQVAKRSIVIAGNETSVSLEDAFWKSFKEIARERHMTLSELAAVIDSERGHGNLSSAIRLFVLGCYLDQISEHLGCSTQELSANVAKRLSTEAQP